MNTIKFEPVAGYVLKINKEILTHCSAWWALRWRISNECSISWFHLWLVCTYSVWATTERRRNSLLCWECWQIANRTYHIEFRWKNIDRRFGRNHQTDVISMRYIVMHFEWLSASSRQIGDIIYWTMWEWILRIITHAGEAEKSLFSNT